MLVEVKLKSQQCRYQAQLFTFLFHYFGYRMVCCRSPEEEGTGLVGMYWIL